VNVRTIRYSASAYISEIVLAKTAPRAELRRNNYFGSNNVLHPEFETVDSFASISAYWGFSLAVIKLKK